MLVINDQNENCINDNGQCIFLGKIDTDEDILIQNSCIFINDLMSTKNIKAQYDLMCFGNIKASLLSISGNVTCLKNINATNLEVGGSLEAEDIKCNSLHSSDKVLIKNLFCTNISAKGPLVVSDSMDIQNKANVEEYIVCMNGLQIDGQISGDVLIIGGYSEIYENKIKRTIHVEEKPKPQIVYKGISDSNIEELKNYESPLSVVLEDVACFIEKLHSSFNDNNYSFENEIDIIKDYSAFFPDLDQMYKQLKKVLKICESKTSGEEWFDDFIVITKFLLDMPTWLEKTETWKTIYSEVADRLQQFITKAYKTKSAYKWATCLSCFEELCERVMTNDPLQDKLRKAISILFSGVGIKERTVKMYLSQ